MERHFLDTFFNPHGVAVVGASRNPLKISHNLLANLVNLKYEGPVYPVNPGVPDMLGIKTFPRLQSIEQPVDLVVCGVPATASLDVIKDCVEKRVKAVVVVAGGFSETGEQGRALQAEIARLLRENGIRAIGPNSLSPINTRNHFLVGFSLHEALRKGGASFIFQSGLYEPRLDWIMGHFHLGLNKLIDLGNKMDVNEVEALAYLADDPETTVIALHLESIAGDAREFFRVLKEASAKKPVVVLKSARTPSAAKAASSHTGAIATGNSLVFDAALRQTGAVRAQTLEEFFDFTKAFEYFSPLRLRGNRIAVATFPGGEAVLTTDVCEQWGFTPAKAGGATFTRLQAVAGPWPLNPNPFDLGVSSQFNDPRKVYRVLLEALTGDEGVDCLAVEIEPGNMESLDGVFEPLLRARERGKPLTVWPIESLRQDRASIHWIEAHHIPVYPTGERAVKALAALRGHTVR